MQIEHFPSLAMASTSIAMPLAIAFRALGPPVRPMSMVYSMRMEKE